MSMSFVGYNTDINTDIDFSMDDDADFGGTRALDDGITGLGWDDDDVERGAASTDWAVMIEEWAASPPPMQDFMQWGMSPSCFRTCNTWGEVVTALAAVARTMDFDMEPSSSQKHKIKCKAVVNGVSSSFRVCGLKDDKGMTLVEFQRRSSHSAGWQEFFNRVVDSLLEEGQLDISRDTNQGWGDLNDSSWASCEEAVSIETSTPKTLKMESPTTPSESEEFARDLTRMKTMTKSKDPVIVGEAVGSLSKLLPSLVETDEKESEDVMSHIASAIREHGSELSNIPEVLQGVKSAALSKNDTLEKSAGEVFTVALKTCSSNRLISRFLEVCAEPVPVLMSVVKAINPDDKLCCGELFLSEYLQALQGLQGC